MTPPPSPQLPKVLNFEVLKDFVPDMAEPL